MIGKLQEADHYWNETGAHLIAAASSWNGANECLPVVIVGVRVFGQETLLYRNLQAGFSSRVERQCSKQLFPTWESPPRVFNDTVLKTQPLQEQLLSGWQPDPGLSGIGEGGQEVVVIVKLHRCGPSFTQGSLPLLPARGPLVWVWGVYSYVFCSWLLLPSMGFTPMGGRHNWALKA